MAEEKVIPKKYIELQTINQQIQQLHEQSSVLEQQKADLLGISQSLDDLDKVKADSKMYAPLGGGLYVESVIKSTKKVLTNVGSGVVIPKSLEETKQIVEEQIEDVQKVLQEVEFRVQDLMKKGQQLHKEMLAQSEKSPKKKEEVLKK